MIIILLGPPGSGKGTIAGNIASNYPYIHVSTGDLFRKNIEEQTELGQAIEEYMSTGRLVPDDLAVELVSKFLQEHDVANILLDGFPRTLVQAEKLDQVLTKMHQHIGTVLHIRLDDEVIKQRISGRRQCQNCGKTFNLAMLEKTGIDCCNSCGGKLIQREDDKEEVVINRLAIYHELTAPLIDYYTKQDKLITMDNTGTIDEIVERVAMRIGLKKHG